MWVHSAITPVIAIFVPCSFPSQRLCAGQLPLFPPTQLYYCWCQSICISPTCNNSTCWGNLETKGHWNCVQTKKGYRLRFQTTWYVSLALAPLDAVGSSSCFWTKASYVDFQVFFITYWTEAWSVYNPCSGLSSCSGRLSFHMVRFNSALIPSVYYRDVITSHFMLLESICLFYS